MWDNIHRTSVLGYFFKLQNDLIKTNFNPHMKIVTVLHNFCALETKAYGRTNEILSIISSLLK